MEDLDEQTLSFYTRRASLGDKSSNLILGLRLMGTEGTEREGVSYIEKAFPLPQAYLCYYKYNKDQKYLVLAAEGGVKEAMYPAALYLLQIETDVGKALTYLNIAVRNGEPDAASCLLRRYINRKEYTNAVNVFASINFQFTDELKKLSGILDVLRGRNESNTIKYLYDHPTDIECKFYSAVHSLSKGKTELIQQFTTSKEKIVGYENVGITACTMLARALKNGINGIQKDFEKAVQWYIEAEKLGFTDFFEIAECCKEAKKVELEFDYLNKAASVGCAQAMVLLAKIFIEKNTEDDKEMASMWLDQAKELGSEEAIHILASLKSQS
ncbi:hypothetical protein EIN_386860 [Entamoeba invadens IP1]|uniref:Uncharacterized protein n=2 Tax=Entamoeba invadens TaxID=33085 RepID=A0A0A1UAC8_ENTIV|nr:hypothetical protein EIN_386860 [Entamoeba invadens IP1]ELP91992.1 hypothetical protein EIN_386860 [Entamoeba invadens IP1]BAN41788.1 hypothetical protein [Entamoeba invadens]|eukprot:XP_004258763.1 hypothetical protein EIN_386860 [Entamoeba invadens IP1]